MTFAEVTELLRGAGHEPVILKPRRGGSQVLVAPTLSGRVMGTAFDGPDGVFGGFVDARAFREGMRDIWDNWGGEERYWLCPEGGQFGLMFQGRANTFENYTVQPGINRQRYEVVECAREANSVTMRAAFEMVNAAGTQFQVESTRRITALEDCPYAAASAAVAAAGFQSESTLVNTGGEPWTRATGCLAHWHLGQFLPGPETVVIIPYRQGPTPDPPVREDYFREFCPGGRMAPERYSIRDGFVLFKADGRFRTKIGQNRSRATGLMASYNLATNEMIVLDYDFYPHLEYAASYWYEQPEPFEGDCMSFSAEGPDGRCYELEAISPALFLSPGASFTFRTRTMHLRGPRVDMARICRAHLGAGIATLEAFSRASS